MKRSAAALITIPLGVLLAAGVGMSVATASNQSPPNGATPAATQQYDPIHYPTASGTRPATTRAHPATHTATPATTTHRQSWHRTVNAPAQTIRHTTRTSTYAGHDGCDGYGTRTMSQHQGDHGSHW